MSASGDNDVAIAVYEFLSKAKTVTDLLAAGAKSVYEDRAPENADLPALIYEEVSAVPLWALGNSRAQDQYLYRVKGVAEGNSAKAAAEIRDAVESVLSDGALTIPDRNVIVVDKVSNVRMTEMVAGARYNHRGGLYRIWTEPA